jgi:NADPH:quinone reductase-like Zn-dependent oxidoreductase
MPDAPCHPTLDQPTVYELRLRGHLGSQWAEWFEGATITHTGTGDTVLICSLADQAALYGLLKKARDVGIPLLAVNQIESTSSFVSQGKLTMKAVVYTQYGPPEVLKFETLDKPAPNENQVLVKVQAASLNAADSHLRSADIFLARLMTGGLLKPKDPRLGSDLAGRVEAVGSNVTRFKPGDEVFGSGAGAFAEYALARETALALKPANVSFEAAATIPIAALTALQGLRNTGQIQPGQRVLIQGASGGVGMFAVQIAKALGAEVTGVCSTRNMDMVRSIGADHVIDYTREDFTHNGQQYDLILAVNGYHPLLAYRRALSPRGRYVFVGATTARLLQAMLEASLLGPMVSKPGQQQMGSMGIAKINAEDLAFMAELLEAGKVVPVIDHSYPLSEIVQAFRHLEDKHAQGKVIITMA